MLSDNGEQYSQCPCCKACEDCNDLKKTVNIQGAGLVIYQHTPQNQLNSKTELVKDMTTGDVFILQNNEDKHVTMSCSISAEELQNINCPRCNYIIGRAKKTIQARGPNNKNVVIGVCDHCRNRSISQIKCNKCEDIAEKFITSISEGRIKSGEKLKTWIGKVKHLLKTARISEETADKNIRSVAKPQLHQNKLQETVHTFGPGVYSEAMRSKLKTYKADDEAITLKPKPESDIKKIYRTRSFDSYLERLEEVTGVTDITLKSGKLYVSKPDAIMTPSARDYYTLDRKYLRKPDVRTSLDMDDIEMHHILSNIYAPKHRTISPGVRDYDSLYVPNKKYVVKHNGKTLLDSKDSHYEREKKFGSKPQSTIRTDMDDYDVHNWPHKKDHKKADDDYITQLQKTHLNKYDVDKTKPEKIMKEKDIKSKTAKTVKVILGDASVLTSSLYRARSETSIQGLEQIFQPRNVFKSVSELYSGPKPEIHTLKSADYLEHLVSSTTPRIKTGKKTKGIHKGITTSVDYSPNKKYPSKEALSLSNLPRSEITLRKDFSYQFPKEIVSIKQLKHLPTSVELIKETQDMLHVREEEKKQKLEIERTRKRLEEEIKAKAKEEKKRIHEEKVREQEEKKRIAEAEKKLFEEEKRRLEEEKSKVDAKLKQKELKKAREDDRDKTKDISEEEKAKIKEDKEKTKADKDRAKEERKKVEEKGKIKETGEKSKSKKEDKDKENADKEGDKLKKQKEKEIQSRMEKEEKQREKEEKERLKKEKEAQLRAEKDQKLKEKEEKNKQLPMQTAKNDKDEEINKTKLKHQKPETRKDQPTQKDEAIVGDFKKIRDETNSKEETLKRKKDAQLEKRARDEADDKEKEIEQLGKVHGKVAKADIKSEPVKEDIKLVKKNESPIIKELDIKQIKVRKPSYDDLILKLVRLKQSEPRDRVRQKPVPVLDIPLVAREHKKHKYTKASKCLMCLDSEFELDVEDIMMKTDKPEEATDIIIGQKIFKFNTAYVDKEEQTVMVPSIFQSTFQVDSPRTINKELNVASEPEVKSPMMPAPAKSQKLTEQEAPKGIVRYALSDRSFIEKGWTMLPTEKVVRKMNVYRMRPAHPEFDWFEHNKKKKLMLYDSGEKLADFEDMGRSRLYYKNGRLALDYYDAEEINAQQRFVVFSSGELDERGRSHPITVLATFDYLGNGIVFDHGGKIRLKYNQTEGVVLDRNIGPVSHWKWHTLNDPPVLQKVMIDTQMSHKDPDIVKMGGHSDDKSRPDNEEMLAIEFDNFIKEKSKKLTQSFKPFQIKMKALKINEHFSLKILDQATIYLIFRDGTTNIKLNIGMILDHKEIVDTDTAEVGEVSNNLERFPARTESLAGLQRSVAYAQRFERARLERENRLRPPEPCTSADQLNAASSRPLRHPLRTAASTSTTAASSCKCSRKPCSSNVYYDTRLI